MPMSRTPRFRAAHVLEGRPEQRPARRRRARASRSVAISNVCRRVTVWKSSCRSLSVTVRADQVLVAELAGDAGGEQRERGLELRRGRAGRATGWSPGSPSGAAGRPRSVVPPYPCARRLSARASAPIRRSSAASSIRWICQTSASPSSAHRSAVLGPTPGIALSGEARQKPLLPSRAHLHQPPRLGRVGGELGDHPVGADADAAVEPGRSRGRRRGSARPRAGATPGTAARCRRNRGRPRRARP